MKLRIFAAALTLLAAGCSVPMLTEPNPQETSASALTAGTTSAMRSPVIGGTP